jgi:exopolyphosphatase/pppGpp-phosphohydrolase
VDDDSGTITRIDELVAEQHRLRAGNLQGHRLTAKDQRKLADLQSRLDHCWELLRRRRSRRYFGQDTNSFTTPA